MVLKNLCYKEFRKGKDFNLVFKLHCYILQIPTEYLHRDGI